ncbi:hypothetical protein [Micromonospora sp. NPDC049240]|uniref:hypothetical protein n=1 Tax=Micromonospora sp. NPDC049240 TaxID=3155151 RepID=UPI0033E7F85E
MGSSFKPNPRGLRDMQRKLEKELKKYPVRVPVQAEVTGGGGSSGGGGGNGVGGGSVAGSELELVAGWLLDWAYVYSKSKPHSVTSVADVMTEVGVERLVPLVEPHVDVAVAGLTQAGLLNDGARTFGSQGMQLSLWLTDAGQREAMVRVERRKDSRARRLACRDAVLRWVYERDANGESTEITQIGASPYGWFNGELYSAADLVTAVQFLRERRLLGGTDEIPTIEPAGTECIEQYGSVVDYLNRGDGAGVNVTIMGNNSGQLAVANRDVAQNQTNANEGQVLAIFAEALREFGRLLPEDQRSRYEMVASELEQEAAKDEPNKPWVRSLLDRGKDLLESAPANLQHLAQVAKIGFELHGQGLI